MAPVLPAALRYVCVAQQCDGVILAQVSYGDAGQACAASARALLASPSMRSWSQARLTLDDPASQSVFYVLLSDAKLVFLAAASPSFPAALIYDAPNNSEGLLQGEAAWIVSLCHSVSSSHLVAAGCVCVLRAVLSLCCAVLCTVIVCWLCVCLCCGHRIFPVFFCPI